MAICRIDALVQDCSNSIANALELLQSYTKLSVCRMGYTRFFLVLYLLWLYFQIVVDPVIAMHLFICVRVDSLTVRQISINPFN